MRSPITRGLATGAAILALSLAGHLPAQDEEMDVLPGGSVGQDVVVLPPLNTTARRLAAVFAFSNSLSIYERAQSGSWLEAQVYQVGASAGANPSGGLDLPRRVLAHDFSGDSLEDLLIINSGLPPVTAGSLQIFEGAASGAFVPHQVQSLGSSGEVPVNAAILETDISGLPYVVVGYEEASRVDLLRYFPNGTLETLQGSWAAHPTPALAIADILGSAQQEIIAAGDNRVSVFQLTANPFGPDRLDQFVSHLMPTNDITSIAAADIDRDGRNELIVVSGLGHVFLLDELENPNLPPTISNLYQSSTREEFTDVQIADWNGDDALDIVAANNSGDYALLLTGPLFASPGIHLPVAPVPRRLAIDDVDASGLPDLLAAGEANQPLTITYNNTPTTDLSFPLFEIERIEGPLLFDASFSKAAGLAKTSGGGSVFYHEPTQKLIELDDSGMVASTMSFPPNGMGTALSPTAIATTGTLDDFFFTTRERGSILHFSAGAIEEIVPDVLAGNFNQGITDIALAGPNDGLLWLAIPQQRRLLCIRRDGTTVHDLTTALPFSCIAVDRANGVIYLGSPADNRIYWLNENVIPPSAGGTIFPTPISPFQLPTELQGTGFLAFAFDAVHGLSVLTTRYVLTSIGSPASDDGAGYSSLGPLALRRGFALRALAAANSAGNVLLLDDNGLNEVHVLDTANNAIVHSFSTLQATDAGGNLHRIRPGFISSDPTTGNIVMLDQVAALFAVFSPTGEHQRTDEWPPNSQAHSLAFPPFLGFHIDRDTGDYLVLTGQGVARADRTGANAELIGLDGYNMQGLAQDHGDALLTMAPDDFRVDRHLLGLDGARLSGHLDSFTNAPLSGMTYFPANSTWVVSSPYSGELLFLSEAPRTNASAAWAVYE